MNIHFPNENAYIIKNGRDMNVIINNWSSQFSVTSLFGTDIFRRQVYPSVSIDTIVGQIYHDHL